MNDVENGEANHKVIIDLAHIPAAPAGNRANVAFDPITVYRRGHPLPHDLRARAMMLLQQGLPKQTVARRLCISRSTLLRNQKASRKQQKAVPVVNPRGGYRTSVALLNRG
jgi:hypothetical protein